MWHHSTQPQLFVLPRGRTTELQVSAGCWVLRVDIPSPAGWSFFLRMVLGTNQPTQCPRRWEIKYISFLKPESENWMAQSPAPFCPSSPDPDSRGEAQRFHLPAEREPRNFGNTLPSFHSHLFVVLFIGSLIYS